MGYKKLGEAMSFADLAVRKSLEHNRSVKMMERINKVVRWKNIEAILLEHYEVGSSKEGADAYSPLMLLKCMLLQKWFRVPSDPELENQINDRLSFKWAAACFNLGATIGANRSLFRNRSIA